MLDGVGMLGDGAGAVPVVGMLEGMGELLVPGSALCGSAYKHLSQV